MIDKNKQYRTRDGREVRIYATDGKQGFEVHGAVKNTAGWCGAYTWGANGNFLALPSEEDPADLIEAKPRIKRTVWINIYPIGTDYWLCHETKEQADANNMNGKRFACVKVEIDCDEGEGL